MAAETITAVNAADTAVTRRKSGDLPPARLRLASPYDLDARYGLKQGSWWVGHKVHISETCADAADEGCCRLSPA
ncbi:hypothetical protein ACIQU4_06895 [Streptomyces sp. NPDC090741]|uniref:hypothetical protein n=1 Tax=Streptomyces sp. NPDC090741 TaxID=3365967 RepID=UPI0037F91103